MRKPKKHYAVTTENGVAQLHPLKDWFRTTQNVPDTAGMTSHNMRDHLRRNGWQVKETADKVLVIKPGSENIASILSEEDDTTEADDQSSESAESSLFALESHLRDYLSKNLNSTIKFDSPLSVVGVEYSTDVGLIDLLAKNSMGDYYVFELKLQRGADAALGQLLRYMGWCAKHLSQGRKVYGVILAAEISEKLRYAGSRVPDVTLLQYELQIKVSSVPHI
jgi:hypothetical protein